MDQVANRTMIMQVLSLLHVGLCWEAVCVFDVCCFVGNCCGCTQDR